MTSILWAALGVIGGVALTLLSDLLSEEVRTRLDRLPQFGVRLATLRLPAEVREENRREWMAELHQYLHGHEALPVTRLLRGTWFSVLLLLQAAHRAGPDLRELAEFERLVDAMRFMPFQKHLLLRSYMQRNNTDLGGPENQDVPWNGFNQGM